MWQFLLGATEKRRRNNNSKVRIRARPATHHFRVEAEIKSGPAAFLLFCLCWSFLTSYLVIKNEGIVGSVEEGEQASGRYDMGDDSVASLL